MEKAELKIFINDKEKIKTNLEFDDLTYLEEYIELKKYVYKKYELIETDNGFYFYNEDGEKVEYKFTY